MILILLDVFAKGDVYIDYPYEEAKFRYEKQTGKVFRRFYGEAEDEIPPSDVDGDLATAEAALEASAPASGRTRRTSGRTVA